MPGEDCLTHETCVCVQAAQEKSVSPTSLQTKPQEGGVCDFTHTRFAGRSSLCCCCVASQCASSVGGATPESTSTLLALSGVR